MWSHCDSMGGGHNGGHLALPTHKQVTVKQHAIFALSFVGRTSAFCNSTSCNSIFRAQDMLQPYNQPFCSLPSPFFRTYMPAKSWCRFEDTHHGAWGLQKGRGFKTPFRFEASQSHFLLDSVFSGVAEPSRA